MTLKEEVQSKSKEIYTDSYPVSIGELINLYKDGELNIHPDFQRLFRWSDFQKSRLIESLLLGIPIPSIFVSQAENGKWDVVDGLQRLSTIFQFVGLLKDAEGNLVSPLVLKETKLLPSLKGLTWETLDEGLTLDIKRSKIGVQIIQRKSENSLKYELFQRLNTLGSRLSDQELRNCLMIMTNKTFYSWLEQLSTDENFLASTCLSDKATDEKYHMELVLRYLIFKNVGIDEISSSTDLAEFINEKTIDMALDESFNFVEEERIFRKVFDLLNSALGDDVFKKYYSESDEFKGRFLISAFESIVLGLSSNLAIWSEKSANALATKIKRFWSEPTFIDNTGAGANFFNRIPVVVPFSQEFFNDEN